VIAAGIRRGLAAGLLAGILAGVFALVVGHDPMAAATRIEESQHADHADDPAAQQQDHGASVADHDGSVDGTHHGDDGHAHDDGHLVARATQQAMLPVATVVIGLGLGGLFGVVFALLRPHRLTPGDWRHSLMLGGVAWSVTVLLPTLTFPASPPGVGDPASVDTRTQGYLLTIGVGVLAAVALGGLARRLTVTTLHAPARQAVVGGAALLTGAATVALLPSASPGDGFPAGLLWEFRLVSIASQTLLWLGIAVGSGLLWERAAHGGLCNGSRPADAPEVVR
jgi:hypothetical protein